MFKLLTLTTKLKSEIEINFRYKYVYAFSEKNGNESLLTIQILSDYKDDKTHNLKLLCLLGRIYKIRIYVNENIKPIEIKKHGYRAKSLFKYGLEFITDVLLNPKNQSDINIY
jgi:hypothetical protein